MAQRPEGGLIERLSRLGVFARLSRHEVAALIASGHLSRAESGTHLISQGERSRDYLVVIEGELEVRREWLGADGRQEISLGRVRPGEGVGEMAVLSAVPRGASVVAIRPSRVLRIDGDAIDELLSWSGHLADALREDAEMRRRVGTVRQAQAFRRLPLPTMQSAFERMQPVEAEAGQVIVSEGEPGDGYYLIETGRAEVRRCGLFVAELMPGATFGEEALLTGTPRNASVVMLRPGRLWRLSKSDFDDSLRAALIEEVSAENAARMIADGQGRWLDCRNDEEYREAHIPGAQLLPLARLRGDAAFLDPQQTYVVYCRTGLRSGCAAFLLRERGLRAVSLAGGLCGWPYALSDGA